jgi:hypothetical protein
MSNTVQYSLDVANVVVILVTLVGLWFAFNEYQDQRRRAKLELAQELVRRFDEDDMIDFAVTTLDWAEGLLPVPVPWRDVVKEVAIKPDIALLEEALQPDLTDNIAKNPIGLLFRHSFVRLFNHLENIQDLRSRKSIEDADLAPIAYILAQLAKWKYAPQERTQHFFRKSLDDWYPGGKLLRLLDELVSKHRLG